MAKVLPFTALRFDTSKVRLEDVLTQPYDKISPQMQAEYYEKSPHNLIRIELGRVEPGDDGNAIYKRAAEFLKKLQDDHVLKMDSEPSIYAYSQKFKVPGSEITAERRGFIALAKLQDYSEKIVYRHEQTLTKPKADRLNLLRATKAHTGQVFMLYSDPAKEIDSLIWSHAEKRAADAEMTDEYGVQHRLWRIGDSALILQVRDKMNDKKLIIADGHHRYETALTYRAERRADEIARLMGSGRTGQLTVDPKSPPESLMMTFVNMDAEGLVILPTHRVVFGLPQFDATEFILKASDYFESIKMPETTTVEKAVHSLAEAGKDGAAFVAATPGAFYLMRARVGADDELLGSLSPQQRSLDVVKLHKIILEKLLGISEEDIRNQTYLNYVRGADEAVKRVQEGAQVAFLMNPVTIEQMRDVAFNGEVMPQKSTDFYPKLMSGLTIYSVE